MGFSRPEYWSGLPLHSPWYLPNPGIKTKCLASPALAGGFFTTTATLEVPSNPLSSVQFSFSVMSDSLWPHGLQHARHPCPSPTSRAYSNLCLLSPWCHPTVSPSVIPFSSCFQSLRALVSFQMSQFFTSGGQSTGVSASTSVLPMNIQDWFPLGWTGWISLQSKGLSRVFSNTKVQSINFLALSLLYSPTHIHTWLLEKP